MMIPIDRQLGRDRPEKELRRKFGASTRAMIAGRLATAVSESGGIIIYAMTPEVADALITVLYDSKDKGFEDDADVLQDIVDRVRAFNALLS